MSKNYTINVNLPNGSTVYSTSDSKSSTSVDGVSGTAKNNTSQVANANTQTNGYSSSSEDELVEFQNQSDNPERAKLDLLLADYDKELGRLFKIYSDIAKVTQEKDLLMKKDAGVTSEATEKHKEYQEKILEAEEKIQSLLLDAENCSGNLSNITIQLSQIDVSVLEDTCLCDDDDEENSTTQNTSDTSNTSGAYETSGATSSYDTGDSYGTADSTGKVGGSSGTRYSSPTYTNESSSLGSTSTSTSSTIPADLAKKVDAKLGSGFCKKLESVASAIGCNANDLLAMMYSESGLNTHVGNSTQATGLVQFLPSVLSANGYSFNQVKNMSAIQQLDVVKDMLLKSKAMCGYNKEDKIDAGTLYALNFLPAAAKKENLCSKGGELSWAYAANSPLDLDHDGSISKTDLAKRLSSKYQEMQRSL